MQFDYTFSSMQITSISAYQVPYRLTDRKYAWSGGHSITEFLTTIVRISTDEGFEGFSEVCPLGSGYMEAFAKGLPGGIAELGKVGIFASIAPVRTSSHLPTMIL